MTSLHYKSLLEIRNLLYSREISAEGITVACLNRIEATEPKIHACLSLASEQALETAKALDKQKPDTTLPLWGVPVLIKDCITTKGLRTTCGSRILENFVPFYDAFVVEKLKAAGAIILGKTNMDEFAMGSSTESSAFGPTANPWDISRIPGGSSGGSAAAVAAGQAYAALGTDTGGSIRQPAAFCGCVGIKPSYGRVSRYGAVAYGSSLDQIGCFTRTVADAALILGCIAGYDARDSTSANLAVDDYLSGLDRDDLKGIKIGLPKEFFATEGISSEVSNLTQRTIELAEKLGAELVEVSLPHMPYSIAVFYVLASAEAGSNLGRFDGVRYGFRAENIKDLKDLYEESRSQGFGLEVQRRIMLGTYVLSAGYYDAYYKKAAKVRRLIQDDYTQVLQKCDVLMAPVSPTTAWKLGQIADDPLQMYLMDVFTLALNLAGNPGLSIPVGLGAESNMPVGVQLFAKNFAEADLLKIGSVLFNQVSAIGQPKL